MDISHLGLGLTCCHVLTCCRKCVLCVQGLTERCVGVPDQCEKLVLGGAVVQDLSAGCLGTDMADCFTSDRYPFVSGALNRRDTSSVNKQLSIFVWTWAIVMPPEIESCSAAQTPSVLPSGMTRIDHLKTNVVFAESLEQLTVDQLHKYIS